jgi:hypothetical protein
MSQKPAATAIQSRFPGPEYEQIQDWRRRQAKIPPLAEAVRTLVKRGLARERMKREAERDRAATATSE